MFSSQEKHYIAQELEKILLRVGHPEMPTTQPRFRLHVEGKSVWAWADIISNWEVEKRP